MAPAPVFLLENSMCGAEEPDGLQSMKPQVGTQLSNTHILWSGNVLRTLYYYFSERLQSTFELGVIIHILQLKILMD